MPEIEAMIRPSGRGNCHHFSPGLQAEFFIIFFLKSLRVWKIIDFVNGGIDVFGNEFWYGEMGNG
jgi:hypothetical protein